MAAHDPRPTHSPRPGLAAALALAILGASEARADLPKLATEVAFPNLRFDRPVALAYPEDGGNLLFVVEQHQAKVWSFPNEKDTTDKQLFLQLPDEINRGNEEGLLGLAFHPKYKDNGEFFVYYSANDRRQGGPGRRSVVDRFTVSKDDPNTADPGSETRIWNGPDDPFGNHNGGCILFGPDGYLYISLGDSGAADDPLLSGQNPTDFFGSILRIDVDHPARGKAYGIPKDNPRLRDKKYAHWAPEVFSCGIRNIWKLSFDRETGTCWGGDVGQNLWEEVDILVNGGNYGWSVREGLHPFPRRQKRPVKKSDLIEPVVEYPHGPNQEGGRTDTGLSITGGYVYRGKALPVLQGVYVYGDFDSGRIWGLRYDEKAGRLLENSELIEVTPQTKLNIASFGEDRAGELYILAFDGRIHRLVPRR
jgi:glucose/arabinose dehydrogenase